MNYSFTIHEPFNIQKDEDGHYVIGVAYRPGSPASKDSQGDWMRAEQVERMTERFVSSGEMTVKLNHREHAGDRARVVQAFVAPQELSIGGRLVPRGSFVLKVRVDSELARDIRKGLYRGFSISGRSLRSSNGELSEVTLDEVSLVDRPATGETFLITKETAITQAELEEGFRAAIRELAEVNSMLKEIQPEPSRPRRRDTYEDWSSRCEIYEGSRQATRMNAYAESAYQAERRRKGYRTF